LDSGAPNHRFFDVHLSAGEADERKFTFKGIVWSNRMAKIFADRVKGSKYGAGAN
jgi:hypothetical protein